MPAWLAAHGEIPLPPYIERPTGPSREDAQRYQTVIALRYFEGLTLEQIAQVIGRPLGSVKSRLHRARKEMARMLKDWK